MTKLKTLGKWALYAFGIVVALGVIQEANELHKLLLLVAGFACFAYYKYGKQREADAARDLEFRERIWYAINESDSELTRLNGRINDLEELLRTHDGVGLP